MGYKGANFVAAKEPAANDHSRGNSVRANRGLRSPYHIVKAKPWHAHLLDADLREQDRAEVKALGLDPLAVLLASVSRDTRTGLFGARVLCMYGVVPSDVPGVGAIWMLGTGELPNHARAFLRESRNVVADGLTKYRSLMNYVDCRNTVSIRWLKWLGAKFYDPRPYGPKGFMFRPFYFGEDPNVRS